MVVCHMKLEPPRTLSSGWISLSFNIPNRVLRRSGVKVCVPSSKVVAAIFIWTRLELVSIRPRNSSQHEQQSFTLILSRAPTHKCFVTSEICALPRYNGRIFRYNLYFSIVANKGSTPFVRGLLSSNIFSSVNILCWRLDSLDAAVNRDLSHRFLYSMSKSFFICLSLDVRRRGLLRERSNTCMIIPLRELHRPLMLMFWHYHLESCSLHLRD